MLCRNKGLKWTGLLAILAKSITTTGAKSIAIIAKVILFIFNSVLQS